MNLSGHIPLVQNPSTVSDDEDAKYFVKELDIENQPRYPLIKASVASESFNYESITSDGPRA